MTLALAAIDLPGHGDAIGLRRSHAGRASFLFFGLSPTRAIPRRTARSSISCSSGGTRSTIICAT